jgi:hypothetical protein
VVVACLGAASVVHAATIKGNVATLSGPGAFVPFGGTTGFDITTGSRNNDNTNLGLTNPNVVKIHKQFNQNGSIDIVFAAINTNPSGTTEYFFGEKVFNNTGIAWSGYTFELGFTSGGQFVPSTTAKVTFDAPGFDPTPVSVIGPTATPLFSVTSQTANTIVFGGGLLAPGATPAQFGFSIDLGNIAQGNLPADLQLFGNTGNFVGYLFTLRQTPDPVPEPGTLLLIGSGLAGIGVGARRRNRQK